MWTYRHDGFSVHQIPALSDNYIYLIDAPESGVLACVDPAEAAPVVDACNKLGRKLTHVLNTHHHWDHVGGNVELKDKYGAAIVGSANDADRIPGIDLQASEDAPLGLGALEMRVLFVPGHTSGHIAFVRDGALFCGDTLFGAGCGRLFEGTPARMWTSLCKIARLPEEMHVYCAHEYTLNNLKFSLSLEPQAVNNRARLSELSARAQAGKPAVPSTLGDELTTNPFYWPLGETFRRAYAARHGIDEDAVSVFAHIRAARNRW